MINKNINNKGIALSQILILVVSTIAIGYILGSEFKEVSAKDPTTPTSKDCTGSGMICTPNGKCPSKTPIIDNTQTCKKYLLFFPQICCKPESTSTLSSSTSTEQKCAPSGKCLPPESCKMEDRRGGLFSDCAAGLVCCEPISKSTSTTKPCDVTNCKSRCGSDGNAYYGTCTKAGDCVQGGLVDGKTCPNGCDAKTATCKTTSTNCVKAGENCDTLDCCDGLKKQFKGSYEGGDNCICVSAYSNTNTCGPKDQCDEDTDCSTDETKTCDMSSCTCISKTTANNKGSNTKDPADICDDSCSMLSKMLKAKKGSFLDAAATGLQWAALAYGMVRIFGPMLGWKSNVVEAASWAAAAGTFAGQFASVLLKKKGVKNANMMSGLIGAGVGIAVFLFLYKDAKQEAIMFTCYPWDAPNGGENCEKCNNQGLPCSEYQCRSLGQSCDLVNKGTDKEQCTWVNRGDVTPPVLKPWEDVLYKGYKYVENTAVSPPDRGVKICTNDSSTTNCGCIKAFTPLTFGVALSEPAKCKLDGIRKKGFENMSFFMSGSLSLYNHSYSLSLPGASAFKSENITIGTEGEYGLYVRCEDANGNSNTNDFVFSFCVDKGPDTTPPLVTSTNPVNGMPVAFNQSSLNATFYTNEPADCRWSHLDQDYKNMEGNMTCDDTINPSMIYTCETTLSGLKDRMDNNFYIKCKDQPKMNESDRNTNKESYKYTVAGTQPIVIDWIKPENGTLISDATDSIKVTLEAQTSAGYKEGLSNCYYSATGNADDYTMFFKTDSYQHSQELWLPEGDYTYFIKCIDLGGNSALKNTSFRVESDGDAPIIARAYREDIYLKLVTSEPARCVYDTKYTTVPCDYLFDDGTPFNVLADTNDTAHYIDWNTGAIFYIVCQDLYGNQPAPSTCSAIIQPSDLSSSVVSE